MRNVLRGGLAAAALGTAVLAPSASAHDHCPLWLGSDENPAVVAVCTPEGPGSIPVRYGGGTEVCHQHVVDLYTRTPDGRGSYFLLGWEQFLAARTGSEVHCTPDLTQP